MFYVKLVPTEGVSVAEIQSKMNIVKNKNKIFPKFFSPFSQTSYGPTAPENLLFFGPNLHTPLIIEADFFPCLELVLECRNRGSNPANALLLCVFRAEHNKKFIRFVHLTIQIVATTVLPYLYYH